MLKPLCWRINRVDRDSIDDKPWDNHALSCDQR
jgi:hypothetical protein